MWIRNLLQFGGEIRHNVNCLLILINALFAFSMTLCQNETLHQLGVKSHDLTGVSANSHMTSQV